MSYPGDQGPPSRGEWWRPDPGYPTPATGTPEVPPFPTDPGADEDYRGGYPPDAGGQEGGPAGYQTSRYGGGYAETGGYADTGGYGGYGAPGMSGEPGAYGEAGGYGEVSGYGAYSEASGYGGYSEAGGYGEARGYGQAGSYRDDDGYGHGSGYGADPGYGDTSGYGGSPGYADRGAGRYGGAPGYGAASYGAGSASAGSYDAGSYSSGSYGSGPYAAGPDAGRRSGGDHPYGGAAYGGAAYGSGSVSTGSYSAGPYGAGPYGAAGGGTDYRSGGGGYGAAGYGNDPGNQHEPDYGGVRRGPLPSPTPSRFARDAFVQPARPAINRDPARGFPPAPGAGTPAYPPGEFSAWNAEPDDGQNAADGMQPGFGDVPGSDAGSAGIAALGTAAAAGTAAGSTGAPGVADPFGGGDAFGGGDPFGAGEPFPGRGPFRGEGPGLAVAEADDPGWGYDRGGGVATAAFPADAGAAGAGSTGLAVEDRSGTPAADWDSPGQRATFYYPDDALDAPAPPGSRVSGRRSNRPPRRRKLLIAGIAVLVVAALGGTAVYALGGKEKPTAASSAPPTPSKPRPTPTPTLGKWSHLASRANDPSPLTLAELYPATVSQGGQSYTRAAERMDTNCPHAMFGSALKSAMHKGKCTQVARASYLSGDQKVMGTIGVVNLVTYKAATRAGKVVGSNEFIGPLAAAHGQTRKIAKGTGLVQAEIKGHYLILTWAEYADLHKPSTSHDRTVLETFSNELIQLTANRSLTNRMVTGQPKT